MTFDSTARSTSLRLLWHPDVHSELGERCYIYLLTGARGNGASMILELDELFWRLEISRPVMHVVFGQHDVLVRIWLDDRRRQRFIRAIKSPVNRPAVGNFIEFAADEVIYTWFDGVAPGREKIAHANSHGLLSAALSASDKNRIPESLSAENILVTNPDPAGCKFYMFLAEDVRMRHPQGIILAALREAIARAEVKDATIHLGAGFCGIVLKGAVPAYEDVLKCVDIIHQMADSLQIQAWTLVPANGSAYAEGEGLDALEQRATPEAIVDVLGTFAELRTIKFEMESLPDEDHDALIRLLRSSQASMDDSAFARFTEVVAVSILSDRRRINQTLSFVTSIESDMRWIIPKLLSHPDNLGEQWFDTLWSDDFTSRRLQVVKDNHLAKISGPADWTLFDMTVIINVCLIRWPNLRRDIGVFFADGFSGVPDWLYEFRNDFAHGRILDVAKQRSFAGAWGEVLRKIGEAIVLQIGFEALRDYYAGQNE